MPGNCSCVPSCCRIVRKPHDELVELPRDHVPGVRRVLRDGNGGTRQLLSTSRIAVEGFQRLRDALRRHLSHLERRELRYVAPRRRNQLGAATPQLGTRRVVRDDLCGARRAVLEADEPPAFAHRRIDPDVTGVVEQVELVVADNLATERVHRQPLAEPALPNHRPELSFGCIAHDGVVEAQPDVRRLAGDEHGEPADGEVDAFALVGPARIEDDKRLAGVGEVAEHASLRLRAAPRCERGLLQLREGMEAIPIDAVRNDVDRREVAIGLLLTQSAEGSFELRAGEVGVGDDSVRLRERRSVLFVRDPAVQRNAGDDLQAVPIRAEEAQVVVEHPDVVHDEDQRRSNLLDQPLGLEGREDVAALRIGGIDGQAAVADDLAGVADAEEVDLVPVRQPSHDARHHPRQACSGDVEADRDEPHARRCFMQAAGSRRGLASRRTSRAPRARRRAAYACRTSRRSPRRIGSGRAPRS